MLYYFAISWCAAMRWREPYKANIIPLSWTNLMARTSKQTLLNSRLPHGFFDTWPDVEQILKRCKNGQNKHKNIKYHWFLQILKIQYFLLVTTYLKAESHSVSTYINHWNRGHTPAAQLAQKLNWWIRKWQFLQVASLSCRPGVAQIYTSLTTIQRHAIMWSLES